MCSFYIRDSWQSMRKIAVKDIQQNGSNQDSKQGQSKVHNDAFSMFTALHEYLHKMTLRAHMLVLFQFKLKKNQKKNPTASAVSSWLAQCSKWHFQLWTKSLNRLSFSYKTHYIELCVQCVRCVYKGSILLDLHQLCNRIKATMVLYLWYKTFNLLIVLHFSSSCFVPADKAISGLKKL